jgi:hypothetical protein
LYGRIGRADDGRGRDAGLALERVKLQTGSLDVGGRANDQTCGAVVDERAVPARADERRGLGGAERSRLGHGSFRQPRVVGTDHGEPVVVERALRA